MKNESETEYHLYDTRPTSGAIKTRHRGVESRIRIPGQGGERIYDGSIVSTVCGKFLRQFWQADNTSFYSAVGEIYSQPCASCGVKKQT